MAVVEVFNHDSIRKLSGKEDMEAFDIA